MSIDLTILLLRNKIGLTAFCKELNIESYEALLAHCESREIIPCTEAQWLKEFPPAPKKQEKKPRTVKQPAPKKSKTTTDAQKKVTKRTTRRKTTKPNRAGSTQKEE